LKELKNDDTIVIAKGDKGRTTIIMDRNEYDEKVRAHLEDQNIYEKLSQNPTKQL